MLSAKEVTYWFQKYIRINERTVRRWAEAGRLGGKKVRGRWFFDSDQIKKALQKIKSD